ncbi:MAG: 3-dehydroquinate synthase [Alphaproteobacteria bacterium]|nr:3-dehydroquinate synthase [Alphaproteobacteria bacterium]
MIEPQTVRIDLSTSPRGYDIIIGENILANAGTYISQRMGERRCIIVTDSNVAPLYLQRTEAVFATAAHTLLPSIVMPAGESSKSVDGLQTLLGQLFDRALDRETVLIALGGGVIGDLTGFAASIALRGLNFVQIPTTLLAQVDSSVGGKTGINSSYGKNTLGSFYQPRLVLADTSTLDSLPERQMMAGYAEVVKYGLIHDLDFFMWCDEHASQLMFGNPDIRIQAISKSCAYKAQIVAEDERESGRRALLNLGHTFGHALESVTGFSDKLFHGEAVSIGTVMAFDLSAQMGLCPTQDAQAVRNHLIRLGLPVTPPNGNYDIDELMNLMAQDKKASRGKLTLILTKGIGQAFIAKNVDPQPIRELWAHTI